METEGISVKQNFITSHEVFLINEELNKLFNRVSVNGRTGYISINRKKKCITIPAVLIKSVNLLDIAVKTKDYLIKNFHSASNKEWKLTQLEIFEEKNHEPLFWHTDNRPGVFRAFIYLEGGDYDSGAFKYIKKSHRRSFHVNHKLSEKQLHKLKEDIFIARGQPGTLVIADVHGFHGNQPKIKKRRIIMMEFQNESHLNYPSSYIVFSSNNITSSILSNFELFTTKETNSNVLSGSEQKLNDTRIPFDLALKIFMESLINILKTIKRLLKRINL